MGGIDENVEFCRHNHGWNRKTKEFTLLYPRISELGSPFGSRIITPVTWQAIGFGDSNKTRRVRQLNFQRNKIIRRGERFDMYKKFQRGKR